MILKEIVDRTTVFFKEKNFESARLESELLIANALGLRRIDLYLKFEQPLREDEVEKCRGHVRRRAQGEPVAYILGHKDFFSSSFEVDSRVLIPRPETETLVEMALDWIKTHLQAPISVLDLGAGSGCIGLSVAKALSEASVDSTVTLVESSEGAFEVLEKNQSKLNLNSTTEAYLSRAQEFSVQDKKWDVILANPPYICPDDKDVEANVKKFEPHSALYAGKTGMAEIMDWSTKFSPTLHRPGIMIFEIGMTQGQEAKNHFESLNIFDEVRIQKDLSGLDRFVVGEILKK